MRIIACGGAGYIGAHMCRLLSERGHEAEVIDDLSTGHLPAVRWGRLHRIDIADSEAVAEIFRRLRPQAVFHFAAKSLVGESVREPSVYYRNNVSATLSLLEHVRRQPGCCFVFSSTAAIFGRPQQPLIAESHPKMPINAYGHSKLMVEQVLEEYWRAYQVPSVSLRYFNAAGAEPSASIGEAHRPETHLIPKILESALGRGDRVSVYGTDYPTPDGTCVRDYVHVDDLCDAHFRGLKQLLSDPGCYAYNLGNGQGFSVMEVLAAAGEVIGRSVQFEMAPPRAGDPDLLVADSGLARRVLGWQPQKPSLHEIIESAWRWHCSRSY